MSIAQCDIYVQCDNTRYNDILQQIYKIFEISKLFIFTGESFFFFFFLKKVQ